MRGVLIAGLAACVGLTAPPSQTEALMGRYPVPVEVGLIGRRVDTCPICHQPLDPISHAACVEPLVVELERLRALYATARRAAEPREDY